MANNITENKYILKRKIKSILYSIPFYVFRICPINKKKIVFWTLEGAGGYSCNPKYIAEEIIKRNKVGETNFKLYWIVKNLDKEFSPEIVKVKDTWLNRAYHMTTAKFWIGNTRTFWGTKKRKGTIYIQTWHGSISLKPIGKCRGSKFSKIAYLVSKADSDLMDVAISGSKWCTDMWPDGLIYAGEIKQLGSARCDVIINSGSEIRDYIRKKNGLSLDSKIAIFCPTFRGGSQSINRVVNDEEVNLNFGKIIEAFEQKFGGEWFFLVRLHPQLAEKIDVMKIKKTTEKVIDVTKWPDVNEIMAATDAIITDYSTCIFEGFLNGQAGFIYADDLEKYVMDRGDLMFDLKDIPFSYAKNENELIKNILSFDTEEYIKKCESFKKKCGVIEKGYSAKNNVDYLITKL